MIVRVSNNGLDVYIPRITIVEIKISIDGDTSQCFLKLGVPTLNHAVRIRMVRGCHSVFNTVQSKQMAQYLIVVLCAAVANEYFAYSKFRYPFIHNEFDSFYCIY